MQYQVNDTDTFPKVFTKMTATINPVAVTRFFIATCHSIFEYLLAIGFKNMELFSSVSTYFGTVKTNGREMLHLPCLVWLYDAFYIT